MAKFLMEVSEIMSEYESCYMGGDWEQTLAMFKSFKTDSRTLKILQEILEKDGYFREPITIDTDVHEDTGEVSKYVADGTHRLLAAYMSGIEEVYVRDGYGETDWNEGYLKTCFEIPAEIEEEVEDQLEMELRSFALDENHWVTSSGASRIEYEKTFYWDTGDKKLIPMIHEYVVQKIREFYGEGDYEIKTEWDSWDEEDQVEFA